VRNRAPAAVVCRPGLGGRREGAYPVLRQTCETLKGLILLVDRPKTYPLRDIRASALNHRSRTPPKRRVQSADCRGGFEEWALLPYAPAMFSALRASKRTKGKRTEQQEDQDEDDYQFLFT